MSTLTRTGWSRERPLWLVAAVAVFATAVWWRFETLDQRPLWLDEQSTARVVAASSDLAALWQTGSSDDYLHPPLAYLGQWLTAHDEQTRFRLRLPSAIAGLVSIAVLAALGRLVFDPWTGILAAGLMALSIYHVDFSQEARPYMPALAVTLGQYLALLAWLARGRVRWLVCFATCAVLALYTYHLALIHVAVAAGVAVALALRIVRSDRDWKPMGVTLAVVALAYVPQLANLAGFLSSGEAEARHTLALGPQFLHAVAQRWGSGSGATTLLYEACFFAGMLRIARRRDASALALLGWILGPLVAFAVMPFAKYFDLRFLISSLPAFFLVVAVGVTGVTRAAAAWASRIGLAERTADRMTATLGVVIAVAFVIPAWHVYERFRAAERRCGEFLNHIEILEENDRLCADQLVLNSIWVEHQWIVRSLRPVIGIPSETLDRFAGFYRFENGPGIAIRRSGDHLVAQVEGRLAYRLDPDTPTRFFYRTLGDRTVEFTIDEQGQSRSLVLTSRGGTARASRER